MAKRAPRTPRGRPEVVLPGRTPAPPVDDAARWSSAARLATNLAEELSLAAVRLRDDSISKEERDALTGTVVRMHLQRLGYVETKQVAISFVLAVEHAASFRAFFRAAGSTREPGKLHARRAHSAFAGQWPAYARLLSVADMDLALRAVDGTAPGGKWETLAVLVRERLRISIQVDTLRQYLKRYRQAVPG